MENNGEYKNICMKNTASLVASTCSYVSYTFKLYFWSPVSEYTQNDYMQYWTASNHQPDQMW
jgi:hypothetical protein